MNSKSATSVIHFDAFPKYPTQNKLSARQVIKKDMRQFGYPARILFPKPPTHLTGLTLDEVLVKAEKQAELARDTVGRKLRKDGLILLRGYVTYPTPIKKLTQTDPNFRPWVKLTHSFLRKQFNKQFVSSFAALDEDFYTIRFYVLPTLDDQNHLDIASIHPALRARQLVSNISKAKKEEAYNVAMRQFQENYYQEVSRKIGCHRPEVE